LTSPNPPGSFEPKILAFLCNWSSYQAADLAGASRSQYLPNVHIIRVMCSGSIAPVYVLKALLDGIDGILIGCCHPGECHYRNGYQLATQRIKVLKATVGRTGLDESRIRLRPINAGEEGLFRETVDQFTSELRAKGPNPARNPWEIWQETFGQWIPQGLEHP
jgi:F420-non-reducing hydrogenase iron-sulfur subunit